MPRDWGTNSKAAEAKAREAEKKRAAAEKKQQEADDAYWKDDDKHAQKKLERKDEKQKKHEEEVKRKQETRKLLEMEQEQLKASSKPKSASTVRPTRAQIETVREKAEAEERKRLGIEAITKNVTNPETSASTTQRNPSTAADDSRAVKPVHVAPDTDSEDDTLPIEENVNRMLALNIGDGSARNVDEALVLLRAEGDAADAHPERRMKKAHLDFQANMLEKLRIEYPNMRLSQLKEMVWKEWQRAPQNPLNMAARTASTKSNNIDE